jgi:hypothetical protein
LEVFTKDCWGIFHAVVLGKALLLQDKKPTEERRARANSMRRKERKLKVRIVKQRYMVTLDKLGGYF